MMSNTYAIPIFIVKMKKEESDGITIIQKGDKSYFDTHQEARTYTLDLVHRNIFYAYELEVKKMYKIGDVMQTHLNDTPENNNSHSTHNTTE